MLSTLEDYLLTALRQVHPAELTIRAGPSVPPATTDKQLLTVTAASLQVLQPAADKEDNDRREPAYFTQRFELPANGKKINFKLPAKATGQLAAVESRPGKIAQPGDDYRLEGNTLKFYHAPEQKVVVQLRGERARGYRETLPCRIAIELAAWAETAPQADKLLTPSIAAVLTAFIDLDVLELAQDDKTGIYLRLLKPVARIQSIERSAEPVAQAHYIRSLARLQLRGELELTLMLGAPPAVGVIEEIVIRQQDESR
ncbi:MAG: hypothetical protein U1F76_20090 [Candidatus Competibacteraceae bacterium]